MKRLGHAALLTLVGACYSLSATQEPKALPAGAVRGAAGLAFDLRSAGPSAHAAARVGLGLGTEARLKLSTPGDETAVGGAEAGINVQPYDSERVGLFLMPHYRYYAIHDDTDSWGDEDYRDFTRRIHAFAMPMLVVFHLGAYEVFLGPDAHGGTRDREGFLALGGHVGASVAASRFVHLTLETGVLCSVAGPRQARDEYGELWQRSLTVGRVVSELGFSVSFGSPYRR
jgi:hypothetical protein